MRLLLITALIAAAAVAQAHEHTFDSLSADADTLAKSGSSGLSDMLQKKGKNMAMGQACTAFCDKFEKLVKKQLEKLGGMEKVLSHKSVQKKLQFGKDKGCNDCIARITGKPSTDATPVAGDENEVATAAVG